MAPVGVTVVAGFLALDEPVPAPLEGLLAAAAARPDQVLQTRRRVLRQRGLGKDPSDYPQLSNLLILIDSPKLGV
jgi:hypothetical protein